MRPQAYIPFELKARGNLYDSMLPQGLLQHCLQQRCNIVASIVNKRMYCVAMQYTWEPLGNSIYLISKGVYQPTFTNLNNLI